MSYRAPEAGSHATLGNLCTMDGMQTRLRNLVFTLRQGTGTMKENAHSTRQQAPWHLWLVGILGLLFNSVGAFDYLMTQTQNESYMGRFTSEQLEILYGLPVWLVAFWALAVWGGALGALLMLLRRRIAVPVLLVSLVAMIVTAIHDFFSANGLYETGETGSAFILVIFVVALSLWLYARTVGERGVLV